MNEDLIARLRAIRVPTKEEIFARPKGPYGLLFSDRGELMYLDLEQGVEKRLHQSAFDITAVSTYGKEVYFADSWVRMLFGNLSRRRNSKISHFFTYNGKIYDVTDIGVRRSILGPEVLLAEEIAAHNARRLHCVMNSEEDGLFGIFEDYLYNFHLCPISSDFIPESSIFSYGVALSRRTYAQIIPAGELMTYRRKYPFSVLSNIQGQVLDINDHKMMETGVRIGSSERIYSFAVMACDKEVVEVAYAGTLDGGIMRARIDVNKKRVIEKTLLHKRTQAAIASIHPVKDCILHEKLMGYEPR